jgi:hypothetical protein
MADILTYVGVLVVTGAFIVYYILRLYNHPTRLVHRASLRHSKSAFNKLLKLAESGDQECAWNVALLYYNEDDNNVFHDYAKALEWAEKLANKGYGDAQCLLGCCYANGTGVKYVDYKAAIYWFEQALKNGVLLAQRNMALCYENGGFGINQDISKYFSLLNDYAAKSDDLSAKMDVANCYYDGYGVEKDYSKSFNLYREIANAPLCETDGEMLRFSIFPDEPIIGAYSCLAACYRDGIGTEVDLKLADYWQKKYDEVVTQIDTFNNCGEKDRKSYIKRRRERYIDFAV